MDPVNFVTSSFSTKHPNERKIPEVRNSKGIIKQFTFGLSIILATLEMALIFLFALRQSDLTWSSNFRLESMITPRGLTFSAVLTTILSISIQSLQSLPSPMNIT